MARTKSNTQSAAVKHAQNTKVVEPVPETLKGVVWTRTYKGKELQMFRFDDAEMTKAVEANLSAKRSEVKVYSAFPISKFGEPVKMSTAKNEPRSYQYAVTLAKFQEVFSF